MDFKDRIRRFLMGRYGGDGLNTALNVLSLIALFAGIIFRSALRSSTAGAVIGWVLYGVGLALLGFSTFRIFSRNLSARRAEYEWYRSRILAPLKRKKNEVKTRRAQASTHRFFRCPKCGQTVRVPKGKGKIKIRCPKCGEEFVKKS